jgi:O-antigen/teichoic acid export membrane protein
MKQQLQEALGRFKKAKLYKRLVKNFSISLGGTAFNMLTRLGNMSFLTKALTVEDYGNVHIVLTLCAFVLLFADIRMDLVLYQYLPQYKKAQDYQKIKGLFWMGLGISMVLGILLTLGFYFLAHWIAVTFYQNTELGVLIRIFSFSILITTFNNVSAAILRIHDRFKDLVLPQSISTLAILLMLVAVYYSTDGLTKEQVIIVDTLGVFIANIPPLWLSFRLMRQYGISWATIRTDVQSLAPHWQELKSTMFQTNLTGYLKMGSDKGGIFLLGVFSSPEQVAYYHIARNMLMPMETLRKNIHNAIGPEIYNLFGAGQYKELKRLMDRFLKMNLLAGLVTGVLAFLLVKPVIVVFATEDYLSALPNFYIQLVTAFFTFSAVTYFCLTVAMNYLKRRNTFLVVQMVFLGIAIIVGLDAVTLALSQLVSEIFVRLGADVYVYNQFKTRFLSKAVTDAEREPIKQP